MYCTVGFARLLLAWWRLGAVAGDTNGHAEYKRPSSHEMFCGVTPAIVPNRLLAAAHFCRLVRIIRSARYYFVSLTLSGFILFRCLNFSLHFQVAFPCQNFTTFSGCFTFQNISVFITFSGYIVMSKLFSRFAFSAYQTLFIFYHLFLYEIACSFSHK